MGKIDYKERYGITMISIVITIIVLIILSGVVINILLGDNGIITRAIETNRIIAIETKKEEVRRSKISNLRSTN